MLSNRVYSLKNNIIAMVRGLPAGLMHGHNGRWYINEQKAACLPHRCGGNLRGCGDSREGMRQCQRCRAKVVFSCP